MYFAGSHVPQRYGPTVVALINVHKHFCTKNQSTYQLLFYFEQLATVSAVYQGNSYLRVNL